MSTTNDRVTHPIRRRVTTPSNFAGRSRQSGAMLQSVRRHAPQLFLLMLVCLSTVGDAFGQVSAEEHKKHHPGQAAETSKASGGGMMGGSGGMMGGGNGEGGTMGGGMGGMMDSMMEKMGAPTPKEMYPRLMDLPDLPMEERAKIEGEAHERMQEGTSLMSDGFDQLVAAAPGSDFAAMQTATSTLREGLARFESGLAAHRAIAEGKAPRNVALQWFKQEMNLLPAAAAPGGVHFFGMSAFHTSVMLLLILFAAAMIWMYFFKMRRAAKLMQELATDDGQTSATKPTAPRNSAMTAPANVTASALAQPAISKVLPPPQQSFGEMDCCSDSSVDCAAEETSADAAGASNGLLRVTKRNLCRLRVAQIYKETGDVKTFRLVACHGIGLPFSYLLGQFLTLTLPVGEKPIRRSYTISSSPTQGYYCEISVKREEKGAGSRYLHDKVAEGDMLDAQAPSGKFVFTGAESNSVVLIGGGVGITPMMSITRALTDMGWSGAIHFIAACQDPEHFIFSRELQQLQERHPNLHLHAAMSRIEADIDGYRKGRLSKEMLAEWIPDIASQRIHLCGAPSMMESTRQTLAELGVPADQIHTENFGSQHKLHVKAAQRAETAAESPPPQPQSTATVTFQTSGKSAPLNLDDTVLDAAEQVGIDIDNSCRVGSCGMCTVKLLFGDVDMEVDDGLEPDDEAAGMILACQAKSSGDVTVEA